MFRSVIRVLAAAVSSACIVAPTPSLGLTITINSSASCSSSVDGAGNVTINCSGGTTNPSCSVSAVPTSLPASGGTVTLSSNCGAVTSWSGGKSATGGTQATWTDTIPANTSASSQSYRYTVVGANGTNFVDVSEAGAGAPPPPIGSIQCTNIAGISSTTTINVSWQYVAGLVSTKSFGGFAPGQAVVFAFTVPGGVTSGGSLGNFSMAPTDASAYNNRFMGISDTPCDLSGKMGPASVTSGANGYIYFSVGGYPSDKYGRLNTQNPNLNPGQTYYVTVIQEASPGGDNTCSNSACNINFGLAKPAGT
jgi:hypothetical protein